MCFHSKRDKTVVKAMLWRAKTNISRNKKGVIKGLQMTLIVALMTVLLVVLQGKKETNVEAQNYVTVTSSGNLTDGSNFFVDPTVSSTFSLPLCNSPENGGNTIAYIVPQASNVYYQYQEQAAIDGINAVMVNAYKLNNPGSPSMNIQTFASETDLNSYVTETNYRSNQICFAYSFSSFDPSLQQFEFNLLFYRTSIPETRVNQTSYQQAQFAAVPQGSSKSPMPAAILFSQFNLSGFQQLMTTVTQQVILQSLQYTGQTTIMPNFTVAYLPMNTGTFTVDGSQVSLVVLVGLLAISIQIATSSIITNVINEPHEDQLKQLLRQSGMSVQSEVVYRFTIYSILCAILVPLLSLFFKLAVLRNVSFVVIFLLMIMFVIEFFLLNTILTYGFGKYAPIAHTVYNILIGVVLMITGLNPNVTQFKIIATSFIPSMQLQNFAQLAFLAINNGSPSINLGSLSLGISGIKPSEIFIIGLVDLVIFALILLYLWPLCFKVDPEKRLRFYYPFTCSYWQRNANQQNENQDAANSLGQSLLGGPHTEKLQEQELVYIEKGMMEVLKGTESNDTLKITNLVKTFGKKVAVNNLTLTLFKDQILVLLGHNGAGKTTTISMLTREIKPTSGTAKAFGIDLFSEGDLVDLVQFCPQSNILIEKMTVYENLMFFCLFRSVERPEAEITQILEEFNMLHKQHSFAGQLSGGQKRKLQLMIAIIGNSKILLLDEPSSGMDPNSRRETWNILSRLKKDRIVVLTTHYMDEAEVLGDRVAIVSHGELQCCGSSLFLKNKYSNGFFIQISKIEQASEASLLEFEKILTKYLDRTEAKNKPLDKQINESGMTVYTVPNSLGEYFTEMFINVDANLESLNISQYCIRSASLEEVFIDIGEREKQSVVQGEKTTKQESREASFLSLDEQRTELGEKSFNRSLGAFLSLNIMTSIPKIIIVLIIALLLTALGASITIFQAKVNQPPINFGSVGNVYGNDPNQVAPVNPTTIAGNQSTTPFVCDSPTQCPQVENTEIQGDSSSPLQALSSWGSTLQANYGVTSLFGSLFIYSLPTNSSSGEQMNIAVYGNLKSLSSQNVYGNLILNRIGQFYTGNSGFNIQFVNQPLPGNRVLSTQTQNYALLLFQMMIVIFLVLTILTSRQIGIRFENGFYFMLMTKSGQKKLYFTSILLVDFITHVVIVSAMIAVIYAFGLRVDDIVLFALLFCIANPLFIQAVVIFFGLNRKKSTNFVNGILITMISLFLTVFIIFGPAWYVQPSHNLGKLVGTFFVWLPIANFVQSILSALIFRQVSIWNGQLPQDQTALGQYGAQTFFRAQIALILVYGLIVLLALFGLGRRRAQNSGLTPSPVQGEDKSVLKERNRLKNDDLSQNNADIVRAVDLVKQYETADPNPQIDNESDRPSFLPQEPQVLKNPKSGSLAVKGVSFGVSAGEVFALLGVSGAGKTSTFNMILGEENLSGGQCQLNGVAVDQIYQKPEDLFGIVGYCPQTNPIEDSLTVKQSLIYIANLLGVKQATIESVIKETIARFGLTEFTNTKAGNLSGGNKRKLCCAMSMLGNPKVMFVDEASAGVDPISRRTMWKGMRFESINSALILTTHTLEEVEALASKIGIMVSGHLKCYGSLQQIQTDYGSGFEIEINLNLAELDEHLEDLDSDKRFTSDQSFILERLAFYENELKQRDVLVNFKFVEEFAELGLFSSFFNKVTSGEVIDMVQLQKEVQVQNAVSQIVVDLSERISSAQVISYDGSYLQLRLEPKVEITFGKVYGMLENLKSRLPIREYSCKQSSLEQIFVSFAKNDQLKVFNQRLTLQRKASQSLQQ